MDFLHLEVGLFDWGLSTFKTATSLQKYGLKNDPLWWNGISRVSRCYLSLPTQYQFVIAQTGEI